MRESIGGKITFIPNLHGGIIFITRDEITNLIYIMAKDVAAEYSAYKFKMFEKTADEPILSLCMAAYQCRPIEMNEERRNMYVFYPTCKEIRMDVRKRDLAYTFDGKNWIYDVLLVHWQNYYTKTPLYEKEVLRLKK